jgi:integrase/recombinase XerD
VNRTVNLTKRVQTSRGLRYCPVVFAANGRVRADLVIINSQEERHPEGAYYLEWWEGVKRVRLSVGKDVADASARRLQKEAELNAVNHGVAVTQNGNGKNPARNSTSTTSNGRTFSSSRRFCGR